MLVIGCLGLPQAFLKQTILSGQAGLGESAAHKSLAGLFLCWGVGADRVYRLPPAPP